MLALLLGRILRLKPTLPILPLRLLLQLIPVLALALPIVATIIFVRGYVIAIRSGTSSIGLNAPRLGGGTICYLAELIGAILLILGYRSGFYIAAIAIIVLSAFLISGAWLLMIGIFEDRPPRST